MVNLHKLPKLSIATKLYAIFALMAIITGVLAAAMVLNARAHQALTDAFDSAYSGMRNVERVNGLIYAVEMDSRGIYLSPDADTARKYADSMLKYNDSIGAIVANWQVSLQPEDSAYFSEFAVRIDGFQEFRRELARRGAELGPAAAREWGDTDANHAASRTLNQDLEKLGQLYATRSKQIYSKIDAGIDRAAWLSSVFAVSALLLAAIGMLLIWRAVARPLAEITRVTEAVAQGAGSVTIPYKNRTDEVGAVARSIAVFQDAMRRNEELNRTVVDEAASRAHRQEQMAAEIDRFGAEVEMTVADLGRICDQMLEASAHLATVADQAASRTAGATTASAEASNNVRDIASAADELAASVMEIDRQVSQSNAVASKAVGEAERTNAAVKELDEAARRIGDVIRLITDIAEQTNLLALNATIEAARAGEAGRGFAVVASEVKALAGQTARATDEIATQIDGMQQATLRSIEAISRIEKTIREIGEISGAIAAAVTEQGVATQEIARSVETAARKTIETAEEVGNMGQATANTRASATTAKSVADDLSSVAGRIRSQVDQFFQHLRVA